MQNENTNALYDDNGNVIGKIWAALTIAKEANGTEIEVDEYYNTQFNVGDELIVASSNEKATIISINGNTIIVDKPIKSANNSVLKSGEYFKILKRKIFTYETCDKASSTHLYTYEGYAKVGKWEIRETVSDPTATFKQAAETMGRRIHQNKPEAFATYLELKIKSRETNEVKIYKISAITQIIYKTELVD